MRNAFLMLFSWLIALPIWSQRYEIGLAFGGTNYVGDVGSTTYVNPNQIGIGLVAKINRTERHSYRFSFLYLPIGSADKNSSEIRRQQRGLEFTNSLKEITFGIEYSFWEWDYYSNRNQFVPYLHTGLSGFNYGSMALDRNGTLRAYDDTWNAAIPLAIGYKMQITGFLRLAIELGVRYTFTDNLDGSHPGGDLKDRVDLRFGNTGNNDWYFFNGIILTYTFGRKPCFCPY